MLIVRPSIIATGALAAATLAGVALTAPASAAMAPGGGYVTGSVASGDVTSPEPGRYLVRYSGGTDMAAVARGLRSQGVEVRGTFSRAVRAAAVTTTAAKAAALARSPHVEAVEVDGVVQATGTQFGATWGLDRIDQRNLPLSTDYTAPAQTSAVDAYVVDTGVLAGHAEFGARLAPGYTAITDGLGSSDCNGHGTHVAGTVAGSTYGVAKSTKIIPVRVLDCYGSGYMSDVVAGLDWVVAHHAAGAPAVANLSLGGEPNSTVDAALQAVIGDGVTATVAAGNSAVDACSASPARVPAAITVAATNSSDQQATFSNYGGCVDLYAPGVSITSAWHTSTTAVNRLSGTSMAAPHAAGAVALLLSQSPAATPAENATRLTADSTPGVVTASTSGTPNRLLFVSPVEQAAPEPTPVVTKPAAATGVAARARSKAAAVTWTQGADGGSPLTGQTVAVYSGGVRIRSVSASPSATSLRVTNLKVGVRYRFSVIARNAVGRSPESLKSNEVRPRA